MQNLSDRAQLPAHDRHDCRCWLPCSSAIAVRYGVAEIGTATGCIEQFYAISAERKIKHPAIAAITQAAQKWFATSPSSRTK